MRARIRQKDWDGRYTVFAQLIGDAGFVDLHFEAKGTVLMVGSRKKTSI